ncbi:MAG TPA: Rrf2 family transcriptional regulator [Blastocatellia bacterium]|nr:Rrf2 family transcriptional regulator [Blastocatellia bacterium]
MIFSKATGYGIRALAYLAKHAGENPCGLREIAEAEQIPPLYLSKVLGDLRRQRLVRSTKGIHGGYVLARKKFLFWMCSAFWNPILIWTRASSVTAFAMLITVVLCTPNGTWCDRNCSNFCRIRRLRKLHLHPRRRKRDSYENSSHKAAHRTVLMAADGVV